MSVGPWPPKKPIAKPVSKRLGKSTVRGKSSPIATDSTFDTATGLKIFSDRTYDFSAPTITLTMADGRTISARIRGPNVQLDTDSLKALRGYTEDEIYHLVVPKRTLARRTAEKQPLSVEETDRAVRLARVARMAESIFDDFEKAHRWLRKPKASLGGETPLNYLASETGARVVEEMLTRIDHGILP